MDDEYGHACGVCGRLWFEKDLKNITEDQIKAIQKWHTINKRVLAQEELQSITQFSLCSNCRIWLSKDKMPSMAKWNGFCYPKIPNHLPLLDPITERLISPRIPFMVMRRLFYDFSYGIVGQIINVPVDVPKMVYALPRQLGMDEAINVNIKRNIMHKSTYLSGYVNKRNIAVWLEFLQKSTLYRRNNITVDMSRLETQTSPLIPIEQMDSERIGDGDAIGIRQHSLLWNEDMVLNISPGQHALPLNVIFDRNAEEFAFPGTLKYYLLIS